MRAASAAAEADGEMVTYLRGEADAADRAATELRAALEELLVPKDPNDEKNVILDALKHHEGNRTHTARALGISIRTLRNKLADYRRDGLDV